jgi:hypothetical protein
MDNCKRGLSKEFLNDLNSDTGVLHGFLKLVKSDDTLCLEIRDNYVNIYYRGGSMYKISPAGNNGYRVDYDDNYAKESGKKFDRPEKHDCAAWAEKAPFIKIEMDTWFRKHRKPEREIQQLILRENNFSTQANRTDYFISDIEYADPSNGSKFDIVAIKWLGDGVAKKDPKKATLALVEVKYGDGALKGNAGIMKHLEDMAKFLTEKSKRAIIINDANRIFNQKVKLGLMPDFDQKTELDSTPDVPSTIAIQPNSPIEFILLCANHNPRSTVLCTELKKVLKSDSYKTLQQLGCNVKIAWPSYPGYTMYASQMMSLEEYLPLEEYLRASNRP